MNKNVDKSHFFLLFLFVVQFLLLSTVVGDFAVVPTLLAGRRQTPWSNFGRRRIDHHLSLWIHFLETPMASRSQYYFIVHVLIFFLPVLEFSADGLDSFFVFGFQLFPAIWHLLGFFRWISATVLDGLWCFQFGDYFSFFAVFNRIVSLSSSGPQIVLLRSNRKSKYILKIQKMETKKITCKKSYCLS